MATGIKEETIFAELDSIIFPWSFTLDSMHLFFCNIVPQMVNHWRGKFWPKERTKQQPEGDEGMEIPQGASRAGGRVGATQLTTQTGKKKFLKTADEYNVDPEDWAQIGEEMKCSRDTFPRAFGDAVRSIYEVHHEFKAAEWKNWALLFSPALLQGRLQETHYQQWISFVKGLGLAVDYTLTGEDLEEVEVRMELFLRFYEQEYYQYKFERLAACRSVFHALIHVGECIRWAGPMWVYSQWTMERV